MQWKLLINTILSLYQYHIITAADINKEIIVCTSKESSKKSSVVVVVITVGDVISDVIFVVIELDSVRDSVVFEVNDGRLDKVVVVEADEVDVLVDVDKADVVDAVDVIEAVDVVDFTDDVDEAVVVDVLCSIDDVDIVDVVDVADDVVEGSDDVTERLAIHVSQQRTWLLKKLFSLQTLSAEHSSFGSSPNKQNSANTVYKVVNLGRLCNVHSKYPASCIFFQICQ